MEYSINIVWSIEDVKSIDSTLTDKQCTKVLNELKRKHDANIGINWDVISATIDYLKSEDEL